MDTSPSTLVYWQSSLLTTTIVALLSFGLGYMACTFLASRTEGARTSRTPVALPSHAEDYRAQLDTHLNRLEEVLRQHSLSQPQTPLSSQAQGPTSHTQDFALVCAALDERLQHIQSQIDSRLTYKHEVVVTDRPPGSDRINLTSAALLAPEEIDRALLWLTYDEIAQRLGPPDTIVGLNNGEISWRYDVGAQGEVAVQFMDGHVVKVWR